MQKFFILFTFFNVIISCAESQGKIEVKVTNIENNKGYCIACLYNESTGFNEKSEAVLCKSSVVNGYTSQIIFTDIPSGKYAVMVFHDANKNQKLDKNFLGIPKEGYGASKNKLPFASAPAFNPNSFYIKGNETIPLTIRLRNL